LRYTEAADELVVEMLDRWGRPARTGERFDLYGEMQHLIARISFKIFFSAEISDPDKLQSIVDQTRHLEHAFGRIQPAWLPTLANIKFWRDRRGLRTIFLKLVAERRSRSNGPSNDLLGLLISLKHASNGAPWSDEDIVGEVMSVYFGASVMSATITWMVFLLATNPAIQHKLVNAMQEVSPEPTARDLSDFTFSRMVFSETTRLFPPSWGYPRYCEIPFQVGEYQIPARSLVIPMVYHTHRHPLIWANPGEFVPERFAPERLSSIPPFAHYPFGGGQRMCTGANLGPRIIQLVINRIHQRYVTQFHERFPNDPIPQFGFELAPKDKVVISIQERTQQQLGDLARAEKAPI
jgi:cytochrome P450